ncbi:hypothetical protein ACFQHO_23290 [Actinomadura yumaensis]|uniref:hypothetical protein n=1 Tax=Actinomadura TaxID=1988 RepID=UPI00132BEC63|nr:hypothetical protein [Actinomadura sp. J1-007]MWK34989.1 hypothetical protein [Actinomadura sp. J1-007]
MIPERESAECSKPTAPGEPAVNEPAARSQPAMDVEPAARSQPVADGEPAVRGESTTPNKPATPSEPAVDGEPAVRGEPAVDSESAVDGRPAVDDGPTVRSEPAVDSEPSVDGRPAVRSEAAVGLGRYIALVGEPVTRRIGIPSAVARLPLGMTALALLLLVQRDSGSFALAGAWRRRSPLPAA